jgi:hypothetical protein
MPAVGLLQLTFAMSRASAVYWINTFHRRPDILIGIGGSPGEPNFLDG